MTREDATQEKQQHQGHGRGKHYQRKDNTEDPMAPKTQGALLLQSILQLPAPHNQAVLERWVS